MRDYIHTILIINATSVLSVILNFLVIAREQVFFNLLHFR